MVTLASPWILLALPLPLFVAHFVPRATELPSSTLRFPFPAFFRHDAASAAPHPGRHMVWLAILIWLLLVIAAARPQWVGESVSVPLTGRSLMLAIDISGSMESKDMNVANRVVSRLTAVKVVASEFIERRIGDHLGLILFGKRAYLQAPLTYDRETVRTLMRESAVGLAGQETAIGDAIGLAVKRLREQPDNNRVLVLLTDGANTAGNVDPLKAADLAREEGIRIYTIGIGSEAHAGFGLFAQLQSGAEIDEATLQAIAAKTGGQYFRARDLVELDRIYSLLDEIEPASSDTQTLRLVDEFYSWPLGLALVLSALLSIAGLIKPWGSRSTEEVSRA